MRQKFHFFEFPKKTGMDIYEALDKIRKQCGIPCYLFDVEKAKENVEEIHQNIGSSVKIAYAMKANPWIIKSVATVADYIEVCSEGELELCKNAGIPGSKLVLDGVLKKKGLIERALKMKIARLSIDSREQLELVLSMRQDYENLKLLLRVSSGNQFGMEKQELKECIALCKSAVNTEVVGIQYYPGTQRNDFRKVKRELEVLHGWIEFCESIPGFCLREVEFGGGIGIPYFEGEDIGEYEKAWEEVVKFVHTFSKKYDIIYESGRNIAASCGIYVTEIFAKKVRDGKKVLFCLGGTNHLQYYGGVLGIRTPVIEGKCKQASERMESYMVCGALCSESDVLARGCRLDANMGMGDFVIFHGAGAYSATESPNLFLTMEMPGILLYNKSNEISENIRRLRSCLPTCGLMSDGMDKI